MLYELYYFCEIEFRFQPINTTFIHSIYRAIVVYITENIRERRIKDNCFKVLRSELPS